MDERDILKVIRYIDFCMPTPKADEPRECLESHAYSRWAVNEILDRMIDEAMKLPSDILGSESLSASDIITDFIEEMDYYSSMASGKAEKKIFDTASLEGNNILLYIS